MSRTSILNQPKLFRALFTISIFEHFAYYFIQVLIATYAAQKFNIVGADISIFIVSYVLLMYMSIYIGGYISDTILKPRYTMLIGLILLGIGYSLLLISDSTILYFALAVTVAGNALFQANPITVLGQCYPENDARLDGAYTLYYMSINISVGLVLILPLQVIYTIDWQGSILLCFVAILLSITRLSLAWKLLQQLDAKLISKPITSRNIAVIALIIAGIILASMLALQHITFWFISLGSLSLMALIILVRYYRRLTEGEKDKLKAVLVLLLVTAIFLIAYWKMNDAFNFFAIYHARSTVLGFELGALTYYKINTLFILLCAPLLATYYSYHQNRKQDWSIPAKFTLGMFFYASSFFILALSIFFVDEHGTINPYWILLNYLLQALAELLIIALIGSAIIKFSPKKMVGFMVGLQFMMIGLGIIVARFLLGLDDVPVPIEYGFKDSLAFYAVTFTKTGLLLFIASLVLLAFVPKLNRMINWKKEMPVMLTVSSFGDSLGHKLSKKIVSYIYILLFALVIFIYATAYISARYLYQQQTTSVITSIEDYAVHGIINHDKAYIAQQLDLIFDKNLLSRVTILDAENEVLAKRPNKVEIEDEHHTAPSSFLIFVREHVEPNQSEFVYYPLLSRDDEIVGYYTYQTNFNQFFVMFFWWSIAFSIFLIIIALTFIKAFKNRFFTEFGKFSLFLVQLERLVKNVESLEQTTSFNYESTEHSKEQNKINQIIGKLMQKILESKEEIKKITRVAEEQKMKAKLSEVALQVSHDVRSPLSSLEVVLQEIEALPEETRVYIRDTINRLRDIVNNLLAQYRDTVLKSSVDEVYFPVALLESVIAEKKLQYKAKNIQWKFIAKPSTYNTFILFNAADFKRMLSNIIDNAVEACNYKGLINIRLDADNSLVRIGVQDDGIGMTQQTVDNIFEEGFTYNKENGSGLGLYQVKQAVEKRHGKLEVESINKKGTTVSIILSRTSPPEWFAKNLVLKPNVTVVIIDDDKSIHNVWRSKLKYFVDNITIVNLYSPESLEVWFNENESQSVIYLCDYEFISSTVTGLDIIKKLEIAKYSYLVTSHYEENFIRKDCHDLNLKLIPKSIASFINVNIGHDFTILQEAVLIDDDSMVHNTWELSTALKGITLHGYYSYDDFRKDINQFDQSIVIFIDSNLGHQLKGEVVSKELPGLGYTNIYLITGNVDGILTIDKHIIDVLDKYPPWTLIND